MSTNLDCVICKAPITRKINCIECSICENNVHYTCATKISSVYTTDMLNSIKKSAGALLFRCSTCMDKQNCNNNIVNKIDKLEETVNKLSDIITNNILSELKNIKEELTRCVEKANDTEALVKEKVQALMLDNESIRRHIYRGDVIIRGVDANLIKSTDELYECIFKIAKTLDLELNHNDINFCTFIQNKTSILVKLNSVYKRDKLMHNYFISHNLQLSNIFETAKDERIYINDHLSPLASKINFWCRKLIKADKIKKFRIIRKNMPQAKVTFLTGEEKTLNFEMINAMWKTILNSEVSAKEL
ncbi:hypothetical protein FF38_08041 [Lucilia cuprina]|uniref:Zinc finger PHD-type domain-containing protein n=1 Tax=Lucilia cuprina TaxID=7375 RepID=A0A0L0BRY6_LUCCU|nr:hypothetical protein CVS40_4286 [Lucilia cuprina]KNC22835.1 hypothetical protein FF38_08041 [Lucilia cuprina]